MGIFNLNYWNKYKKENIKNDIYVYCICMVDVFYDCIWYIVFF